ncbi:hypothetical protein ACRS3X_25885 [Ectopseudomonas hydrolytica]|uniref:hypothetical protein n=1 Tax=Ectopseudomonas hydrolytica TaxID=2493633 RepID=UPI003EE2A8A6
MTDRDPDPLTKAELAELLDKGCLHPMDRAAVTLAVYTGLRPGELGAWPGRMSTWRKGKST